MELRRHLPTVFQREDAFRMYLYYTQVRSCAAESMIGIPSLNWASHTDLCQ